MYLQEVVEWRCKVAENNQRTHILLVEVQIIIIIIIF